MLKKESRKVDVEGCADAPTIGGCNFFCGESADDDYGDASGGESFSGSVRRENWNYFWQRYAGSTPPGPLPEGALAILQEYHSPRDPTMLEPESIRLDERDTTHVSWKRTHTLLPDEPPGRPRYAIVVIPGERIEETFREVYLAKEQRQTAEALKVFTEGSREKIRALPAMKFKPRM